MVVKTGIRFRRTGKHVTGIKTIYVSAPLKDGNWLMILQQISKDAFSDLRRTQLAAFLNLPSRQYRHYCSRVSFFRELVARRSDTGSIRKRN